MTPGHDPEELELRFENQRAVVSSFGASLRRYSDGLGDLVWGYSGRANKRGGQGDVLIPFPGRIADGVYEFGGQTHHLAKNDKDGPNAIHGFLRGVSWDVVEHSEDRAIFRRAIHESEFKGYPFAIDARLEYELGAQGLRCRFEMRNTGAAEAPVAAGFHPYFTVGTEFVDEAELVLPAQEVVEFRSDLLPTGRVVPVSTTSVDFRKRRAIGSTPINHCFSGLQRDPDGLARVRLISPDSARTVTVWMDQTFPYLVLYTGDQIPAPHARRALAIEPMTCATDAFNRPRWGLKALRPGESLRGNFGVAR